MATTTTNFSADLPFSIFRRDLNQYSLGEIKDDDSKTFLWYQFMLDVLHDIPRSSADIENVITGVSRVNELGTNPPVDTNQKHIDEFRTSYTSDTVIYWYTRDSFLYRALNIATRIRDGDAIVQFHPIVKDLDNQLKQLHLQQKENGRIKLPMTVYRGQAQWGVNEMEILKMSEGSLISMNTFLSTTVDCSVATNYILSTDKNTSVLFQITINDTEESKQFQTYAHINQYSAMGDEKEVLFGMSSVFRVTSVEEYDCFWVINLELTSCTADANVLKLMNEVKTYLYQVSNRQFPFTIFKQLLTKTSNDYTRSLTELMKFFLNDLVHLFVTTAYKKQGRMIELINEEPALISLTTNKTFDIVHSDQALICLLFDLFNKFLYDKNKNAQEKISFDMNDKVSLLCFGGFLLMTGDTDKGIRYFDMLQKNDSIDKKLRQTIGGIIRTIHVIAGEKELAMKYESIPLNLCESSTNSSTSSSWFTRLMFSSSTTLYNSTEEINQILNESSSIMMEKQSDNDISEKTRLILLGNINLEQQNFIEALNYLEEGLEITMNVSPSILQILDGTIYMLMSSVYQILNKTSKALDFLEKSLNLFKCYYPSTHRIFAFLDSKYAYHLLLNGRPKDAIEYFETSLKNPHFPNDFDFNSNVYFLLSMSYMQCGKLNKAEENCYKVLQYQSSTNAGAFVPHLLQTISQLKPYFNELDTNSNNLMIDLGLQNNQQLFTNIFPNSNISFHTIDEQTSTIDMFITCADNYRHRQDFSHAEIYYSKALEKMTETDSKLIWNVFKKMTRMNKNDYERYRDYFIQQYSKYDENNPEHFQIIAVLQIILYKFSLFQNQFEIAFDCLINSTFMTIKIIYYQINIDSNYITNIYQYIFHHSEIDKLCSILTKSIQIYSTNFTFYIQHFLSTNFVSNDQYRIIDKIIHHSQIDSIIEQIEYKYQNNLWAKSIMLFIKTLLKLLRQSIIETEKTTSLLSNLLLEFCGKYNNETVPLFHLMKTLESLIMNNTQNFLFNLDKLRLNIVNFEYYQKLKDKMNNIFDQLQEDELRTCLENLANNL